MSIPLDYGLAGDFNLGIYTPDQWITGEQDIVTGPGTIGAGQILDRRTVLGRIAATGALVPHAPAASDGSQKAVAILMSAVNTTAASGNTPTGVTVPPNGNAVLVTEVYYGGCFNPDLAIWNAATSTTLLRVAAVEGTNLRVQRPL